MLPPDKNQAYTPLSTISKKIAVFGRKWSQNDHFCLFKMPDAQKLEVNMHQKRSYFIKGSSIHISYDSFYNQRISFHTISKKLKKIHKITSKGEVTLYDVGRDILKHNFNTLQIIYFYFFFHENWYKHVFFFNAEFSFVHNFEKYPIV